MALEVCMIFVNFGNVHTYIHIFFYILSTCFLFSLHNNNGPFLNINFFRQHLEVLSEEGNGLFLRFWEA